MWQHVIIGALVGVAIIYLLRLLRRSLSGQTACQQGICEGCQMFGSCHDRDQGTCSLTVETETPEESEASTGKQ